MNCSLSSFYALLWGAVAALTAAIAATFWPGAHWGLLIAVPLVAAVKLVVIPKMEEELATYDGCMGPTARCSTVAIGHNIKLAQDAASILALISFAAALALWVLAALSLATVFTAWLAVVLGITAESLTIIGRVSCGASIGILMGMLSNVAVHQSCRERERVEASLSPSAAPLLALPRDEPIRIDCINKNPRLDPYKRIAHVGGVVNGTQWRITLDEAIALHETGRRFYTQPPGEEYTPIFVEMSPKGNKYLKTRRDYHEPNNLLSLPECTGTVSEPSTARTYTRIGS